MIGSTGALYFVKKDKIKELEQEIERLNNIIKEVRKYIGENANKEPWKSINEKELLEILDKGE